MLMRGASSASILACLQHGWGGAACTPRAHTGTIVHDETQPPRGELSPSRRGRLPRWPQAQSRTPLFPHMALTHARARGAFLLFFPDKELLSPRLCLGTKPPAQQAWRAGWARPCVTQHPLSCTAARGRSCSPEPQRCTSRRPGHRCLAAGSCQPVPCSSCSCSGQEQWWEQGWEPQPSSCCGGFSSLGQRPAAVTPAELLVPSHTHLCENPCPSLALATLLSWKKQLVCAAGCLPGRPGTFPRRSGAAGGCSKPGTPRGDLSWENAPSPGGNGEGEHPWARPRCSLLAGTCPFVDVPSVTSQDSGGDAGLSSLWGRSPGAGDAPWLLAAPPRGQPAAAMGNLPLPTRLPCRQPHLAHTNPGIFLPVP